MKFTLELEDIVKMRARAYGYKIVAKYIQYELEDNENKSIRIDVSSIAPLQNSGIEAVLDLIDHEIEFMKGVQR